MRLYEFIDPLPCYYHGSTVPDLQILKRQPSHLTDEGVVFAATMPEIAIAMSGHWTDDDFTFGHQTDGKRRDKRFPPYVMEELKPGNFERFFNQSIYLYQVPAKYFHTADTLQDFEVISLTDVPVHVMIDVDDALAYLKASPILHLIFA